MFSAFWEWDQGFVMGVVISLAALRSDSSRIVVRYSPNFNFSSSRPLFTGFYQIARKLLQTLFWCMNTFSFLPLWRISHEALFCLNKHANFPLSSLMIPFLDWPPAGLPDMQSFNNFKTRALISQVVVFFPTSGTWLMRVKPNLWHLGPTYRCRNLLFQNHLSILKGFIHPLKYFYSTQDGTIDTRGTILTFWISPFLKSSLKAGSFLKVF